MDTNNSNNKIQIFNNPQFGEVRVTVNANGEPMFCLADVCKAAGLTNASSVKSRLEKEDVQVFDLHALNLTEGTVGNTRANFITESGLYDVILFSDAPQVRPFRKWVTSEVLPAIRKDGGYMIAREDETEAELLARAVIVAQSALARERERRERAEKQIETDKPKVTFANAVETSRSSCLVGELAKILKQNGIEIGQNRLFEWLRKNHYLCSQYGQRNIPTQKAMENGLFEVKKRSVELPDGSIKIVVTTVVTGKGQIYFINKFLNK